MSSSSIVAKQTSNLEQEALRLYGRESAELHRWTDRLFAVLLLLQWIAGIALCGLFAPERGPEPPVKSTRTSGRLSCSAGMISIFPVCLVLLRPGATLTRFVIAVAQMLWSALLIHLTDRQNRKPFSHFWLLGVSGVLSRLASPHDEVVIVADHGLRGFFWPQSVYGLTGSVLGRTLEHGFWVFFEDAFLLLSIRKGEKQAWGIATVKLSYISFTPVKFLEPLRHAGRRPDRAQRQQARPQGQALGEDLAGAGLAGRDRVLPGLRPAEGARQGRLQPRGLRLHLVHRQLGPAARSGDQGDRRRRPRGHLGAVGQPQLRGPRQSADPCQLSRLADAGRGLCAGRLDEDRHHQGSDRHGQGRQAGLSQGHLALERRGREVRRQVRDGQGLQEALCRRLQRRQVLALDQDQADADLRLGQQLDLRAEPALLRGHGRHAGRPEQHHRRPAARPVRRFDHHRPHLARRLDQEGQPGRRLPDGARRRVQGLQPVRHAARQSRGDDARHLRQHPPQERDGAGHRGRLHPPLPDRPARADLRRRDALQEGAHAADPDRRQGIRHRVARATGRPRASTCSASRPWCARPSSASIARTWSAWACCPCSSRTA